MATEILLGTLNETLEELSIKQGEEQNAVGSSQCNVESTHDHLKQAKKQESQAIYEDEEIKKKQRELILFQNSLPTNERTQGVAEKNQSTQWATIKNLSETPRGHRNSETV